MYGSKEAQEAIYAAERCEREQTWEELPSDDEDSETTDARRQKERAEDNYLNKLIALKKAFPADVCCHYFEIGGCTHGMRCSCGRKRPPWPWIVRKPGSGYCACFVKAERLAWMCVYCIEESPLGLRGLARWPVF